MSKVKIVGYGNKAELWIDNRMVSRDVDAYVFTHEAGERPRLTVSYLVDEFEIEADDVEVVRDNELCGIYGDKEPV